MEVPAILKNIDGFKMNPITNAMEVVEKDKVSIQPYDEAPSEESFKFINGSVERPNGQNPFEQECELVVLDSRGNRHPVLFFLREVNNHNISEPIHEISEPAESVKPKDSILASEILPQPPVKTRVMEDANIRAFDVTGKFLGRGRLELAKFDKESREPLKY